MDFFFSKKKTKMVMDIKGEKKKTKTLQKPVKYNF
jgi:hypothetical protein